MPSRLFSKQNIFSAIAAVVLLSSCKKETTENNGGDGGNGGPVPEKKIAKFYQNEQNKVEFTYNAQGKLSKLYMRSQEDEDQLEETLNVNYGNDGRISNVFTDGYKISYSYLNGNLSKTETVDDQNQVVTNASFEWTNGRLSHYGYFMPYPLEDGEGTEFKLMNETHYEYGADGNVKKIRMKQLNILTGELVDMGYHTYDKYDNKINPLKGLKDFSYGFFQEFNASNVLKETAYDQNGQVVEVTERTYTYDNYGYPLTCVEKRTETGKPAVTETITFTYF